jgi:hypothetical protein
MNAKKTYNELKDEYIREFEKVIKEMEEFRDNTELRSDTKEFEVPLPPKYLIDKRLKTKTYIVCSLGSKIKYACDGSMYSNKLSCLDLRKGSVKKKNVKIESLFERLASFTPDPFKPEPYLPGFLMTVLYIPDLILECIFNICFVKNDRVLKTLALRKRSKP